MDLTTFLLMPPLLLSQQITATISSRAKNTSSRWYCGFASFLSHSTWALSNSFALWKIGRELSKGVSTEGVIALLWYGLWTTAGSLLGQELAIWYESKYHTVHHVEIHPKQDSPTSRR